MVNFMVQVLVFVVLIKMGLNLGGRLILYGMVIFTDKTGNMSLVNIVLELCLGQEQYRHPQILILRKKHYHMLKNII